MQRVAFTRRVTEIKKRQQKALTQFQSKLGTNASNIVRQCRDQNARG